MRTLKDKYDYNRKMKNKSDFSGGYCFGVSVYREYSKSDRKTRATIKEILSSANYDARAGDRFSKGIMCGARDAAKARKSVKR